MQSNSNAAVLTVEQTLTSSELDQARLYLQQTHDGMIDAIKGLTEAQGRFKPGPGSWSIAEIVEHVIFVQERILGPIREQLATAPAGPLASCTCMTCCVPGSPEHGEQSHPWRTVRSHSVLPRRPTPGES